MVPTMPIIAFHPASVTHIHYRPTAVEVTAIAAEVLHKMLGPSGGFLTRQHVPVLERLAESQIRDADLRLLATFIDTHESVFVRLL
jgi:hypothetical protein